ncbi:MAG: phospholipase D-like domain-containing protein [Candidatus Saccharimonas sp.]
MSIYARIIGRRIAPVLIALAVVLGLAIETVPAIATPLRENAPAAAPSLTLPKGVKGWSNPQSDSFYTGPNDKRFTNSLKAALKAAPAGATVRVSTYAISDATMVKAFKDAHKRHVNVQVTTWTRAYKANKKLINQLKKALGRNVTKPSYLKLCSGSCYKSGKDKAAQHAKIVTISNVLDTNGQQVRDVVFITSANFSKAAVTRTWNHSQLVVGCAKMYKALTSYIDGMKYDHTKYFKPVPACGYTLYLYPSARVTNPATTELKSLRAQLGCKVRVMMYVWTMSEAKTAEVIGKLRDDGHGHKCDVAVIVTSGQTAKGIIKILRKHHVRLYNARIHGRYLHAKVVAIAGKIGKKSVNDVFSGSANFSWSAMARNTDTQLKSSGKSRVQEAFDFFDRVAKMSKRL